MRNPYKRRCDAKSKRTGLRCRRWATIGCRKCYYHGGYSFGTVKHGIYARQAMKKRILLEARDTGNLAEYAFWLRPLTITDP